MERGFLFGVTVAAAIGPIALLVVATSLRHGANAGIRAGLGAAVADLFYAAGAAIAGGVLLGFVAGAAAQLRIVASLFLIGFGAWMIWTTFRSGGASAAAPNDAPRPFLTTLVLTLLNPLTIVVFGAFIAQGVTRDVSWAAAGATVLGIFLGSLVVQMALALGAAALRRFFASSTALSTLNVVSGVGIAIFGLVGLIGGA